MNLFGKQVGCIIDYKFGILPNFEETGDIRTKERHRASHRGCGHNFEVLGRYQFPAVQEVHVEDDVHDFYTKRSQELRSR